MTEERNGNLEVDLIHQWVIEIEKVFLWSITPQDHQYQVGGHWLKVLTGEWSR